MRRLPPLNAVRAFEVAARRGGFARAGDELGVSPGAVSRMVRLLEEHLDLALFERRPNGLVPTEAGIKYAEGVGRILDEIERLTRVTVDRAAKPVLTVGVGPTFAARWLIPRLAGFQAREPEIEVRITTGGRTTPFRDDWGCSIRLDGPASEMSWDGLVVEPLFDADIMPVCASGLLKTLGSPDTWPARLLLRVGHAAEDWPRWFGALNHPRRHAEGPVFEYYGQALQAAADGLGVAMGIRPYIDDDLAAGRLIAPVPVSVPKEMRWSLVYRADRAEDRSVRAFRAWLLEASKPVFASGSGPGGLSD